MRIKSFIFSIVATVAIIGCGGGGSSPNVDNGGYTPPQPNYKLDGDSALSGFIKDGIDNGSAILKLDVDGDGEYDGKNDLKYDIGISDGRFTFTNIKTPKDGKIDGQLIVTVDGYAPYQQQITLHNGDALSVDASAALNKPVLKSVVNISNMSQSARLSSFIRFGIKEDSNGIKAFSKLMTLQQLQAEEKNATVGEDALSTYTISLAAVPDNVKVLQASMQAFDSSKEEDLKNFPGAFKGVGLSGKKASSSQEVGLKSAAFDMFNLTDQNGKTVVLTKSKFTQNATLNGCTNIWTRRVNSAQRSIILSWGDYDNNSSNGYQVPIWSNDNSQQTWKYVGLADYYDNSRTFKVCIPDNWGRGYLNCDSPFSITKPTTFCVNAVDVNSNPINKLYIYGNKAGLSVYKYTASNGEAILDILDNNISGWKFNYRGNETGWFPLPIDSSLIKEVNSTDCSYEANITVISPFNADLKVTAVKANGSVAKSERVYIQSVSGGSAHRLFKSALTDVNGTAHFKVEKNIKYRLLYRGATAYANVDGTIDNDESADSGSYADVTVREQNTIPTVWLHLNTTLVNTDLMDKLPVTVKSWDRNGDTLQITSIKLNSSQITLLNKHELSNPGNLITQGDVNVSGLSVGSHNIEVMVSDGQATGSTTRTFIVKHNREPIILSPFEMSKGATKVYVQDDNTTVVKDGNYTNFKANAYDPDGDSVTITMKLDGNTITQSSVKVISTGNHRVDVTASDANHTSSKSFYFVARNQAPIVGNAGVNRNPVNIHLNDMMTLYAYASDPDGDGIKAVVVRDLNSSIDYNMTSSDGVYWHVDINATALGSIGVRTYQFTAYDNATPSASSIPVDRNVTIVSQNMPPFFYPELSDKTVNINESTTYYFSVFDPEGSRVSLTCSLDGSSYSVTQSSMTDYNITFSNLAKGDHNVTCSATDSEGASAQSSAVIHVIDPSERVPFTVHTDTPGVVVTIHDPNQHYKMLQSATTDSSGAATFALPAGTQRVTFSVTLNPYNEISNDMVFSILKRELVDNAYSNCHYDEQNNSNCSSANWCNILANNTGMPSWVIDLAHIDVNSSAIDTNGDGTISVDEFYLAALSRFDKNGDGSLSLNEIEDYKTAIDSGILVNVPVKTYNIKFNREDKYEHGYYYEHGIICGDAVSFDFNVTNANSIASVYIKGSAYGEIFKNDENSTSLGTKLLAYNKDSNGNYDFLAEFIDNNGTTVGLQLLLDYTPASLASGILIDANSVTMPTLVDVNVTNSSFDYFNVRSYYNDISLDYYTSSFTPEIAAASHNIHMLADSRFVYKIEAGKWISNEDYSVFKNYYHSGYYVDTTLHSSYNSANYPMLDVDADYNSTTKLLTFSGSDLGKIDYSNVELKNRDANYTTTFELNIYKFSNTTSSINVNDLNITNMFPASLANAISIARASSTKTDLSLKLYEFKNLNESQVIDTLINDDIMKYGIRSFEYEYTNTTGVYPVKKVVGLSKKRVKKLTVKNPFK